MKKYEQKELIGEGAYGKVYNCIDNVDNKLYAKKVINISEFDDFLELDFLSKYRHPNIIKLEDFYFSRNNNHYDLNLILEKADCNLKNFFDSKHTLSKSQKIEFMFKLTSALAFIHSNNYCYGDLKPTNILLKHDNNSYNIILCDFSLTNPLENIIEFTGTTLFTSPQGLINDLKPDNMKNYPVFFENLDPISADLFALGMIFYYIWSNGKILILDIPDNSNMSLNYTEKYINFCKNYREYLLNNIKDNKFYNLMLGLINPSQEFRYKNIFQIIGHSFFFKNNFIEIIDGYEVSKNLKFDLNISNNKFFYKNLNIIREFALRYKFNDMFCYIAFNIYFRCINFDEKDLIFGVLYLSNTITYKKFNIDEFKFIYNIKNYSYNFCPYCGNAIQLNELKCCDQYVNYKFEDLLMKILYFVKGNIRIKNMYDLITDSSKLKRGLNLCYSSKNLKLSPIKFVEKYKLS
jgi:serine/threonine protein kinase